MGRTSKRNTKWIIVIDGDYKFELELYSRLGEPVSKSPCTVYYGGKTKHGYFSNLGIKLVAWAKEMDKTNQCHRIQIYILKNNKKNGKRFMLVYSSCEPRVPMPARPQLPGVWKNRLYPGASGRRDAVPVY